jgi:hypothetical protein
LYVLEIPFGGSTLPATIAIDYNAGKTLEKFDACLASSNGNCCIDLRQNRGYQHRQFTAAGAYFETDAGVERCGRQNGGYTIYSNDTRIREAEKQRKLPEYVGTFLFHCPGNPRP